MDNNEYVDNFMKNLRAATAAMDNSQSPEKRRTKIENTIAKWWRTESIGYKYDAEYDRTPFDQDFRDGFDKH